LNFVGALTHQEFEVVEDAATRLEGASEFGFTVDEVEWLCDAAFQAERIIEPVSRATAINDYRYGRCQFRRLRPPEQWRTHWRTAGRRRQRRAAPRKHAGFCDRRVRPPESARVRARSIDLRGHRRTNGE